MHTWSSVDYKLLAQAKISQDKYCTTPRCRLVDVEYLFWLKTFILDLNITWILFAQVCVEGLQAIFSIDLQNCQTSTEIVWVVSCKSVCETKRKTLWVGAYFDILQAYKCKTTGMNVKTIASQRPSES